MVLYAIELDTVWWHSLQGGECDSAARKDRANGFCQANRWAEQSASQQPPHCRGRRSANVEAHELMAMLVQHGVPTIAFSKAKMTAEMIHRYVCETLSAAAPHLVRKVSPYRGGYLAEERREIERRLFDGELFLLAAGTRPELLALIDDVLAHVAGSRPAPRRPTPVSTRQTLHGQPPQRSSARARLSEQSSR